MPSERHSMNFEPFLWGVAQPRNEKLQCSTMAEGPDPSVPNTGTQVKKEALPQLLNLLSPVACSWDLFAQQIGVPPTQISLIRAASPQTGPNYFFRCFTQALEWWEANHHNPVYESMICALDPEVGQVNPVMNRALARELREFVAVQQAAMLPTAATGTHTASPGLRLQDFTQTNESIIQGKFASLLEFVQRKLQRRLGKKKIKRELRLFIIRLYNLPESSIPVTSDVAVIFEAMRSHKTLTYLNVTGLEQVINHFCEGDSEMEGKMEQYKKDRSGFELATKIKESDYISKARSNFPYGSDEPASDIQPKQTPAYLRKLAVKLEQRVAEYHLNYLRELWNSLSHVLSLPPLYILLDAIIMNSILVVWLIPTDMVPKATERAKQNADFFRRYPILKVTIGNECVYSKTEPTAHSSTFKWNVERDSSSHSTPSTPGPGKTATSVERENSQDEERMDSLVSACNLDHSDRLEAILGEYSEVDTILNQRNKDGTTPLHEACCYGKLDCVRTLLKYGAYGSIWDKWGSACIHYAAYNDHRSVVELLLEWSPRPCEVDCPSRYNETPLHMACLRGNLDVAEYLVKKGANPLAVDTRGNTPLHYASSSGNARLLQWLLDLGEDVREGVNWKNQYGQTAAHLAAVLGVPASVGVLVHVGANFSLPDAKGHSALHLADVLRNTHCLGVANNVNRALDIGASVPIFQSQRSQSSDSFSSTSQPSRCSWEDTQEGFNTAYEPPPGMMFTHPIERAALSFSNCMVFSEAHGLKLRVSENHWLQDREGTLEVCLCASMHFNHSFPAGYTIVSPLCFVSCKTERPCKIRLALPHALAPLTSEEDRERITLLSTTTVAPHLHPHSPLFSPSDCTLVPLPGTATTLGTQTLRFKTTLVHPSLFAVAVKTVPGRPLPLRCSLFVTYPYLEPEAKVPGFNMEAYIGMSLPTVSTAMRALVEKEGYRFEEAHFTLASERLQVSGSLSNHPSDWEMEPWGQGELRYSQVALTQDTDSDSYSHSPTYPPRERFFIEPKSAATAVKCHLAVADQQRELCSILAVPYTPRKEPNPERTPPGQFSHSGQPSDHSHVHLSTPTSVILSGYDSIIRISEV